MRRRVDLDFFSRDCQSCDLCAVAYSLLSEYAERRKFCTSIFGPRLEYVFWNTWNTVGILNTGRIQPFTALLEILWNTWNTYSDSWAAVVQGPASGRGARCPSLREMQSARTPRPHFICTIRRDPMRDPDRLKYTWQRGAARTIQRALRPQTPWPSSRPFGQGSSCSERTRSAPSGMPAFSKCE